MHHNHSQVSGWWHTGIEPVVGSGLTLAEEPSGIEPVRGEADTHLQQTKTLWHRTSTGDLAYRRWYTVYEIAMSVTILYWGCSHGPGEGRRVWAQNLGVSVRSLTFKFSVNKTSVRCIFFLKYTKISQLRNTERSVHQILQTKTGLNGTRWAPTGECQA